MRVQPTLFPLISVTPPIPPTETREAIVPMILRSFCIRPRDPR